MNFLNLYYLVKPLIPRAVRLEIRGHLARRQVRRARDAWPIDITAAQRPAWWSGWPEDKKFAFVLTHDVEGGKGLQRCRDLADLEIAAGFRSAFNFVPEGEYDTPAELRSYLVERGFEVGVHDLHHDGTLYRSQADFRESAKRINQYIREWGAAGFRSGFMRHNLDWLKALDVEYDASTFDTDPFEPQPDGAQTIFPFWVEREDGTGYVELPYTLAQDSTLFLVLAETTEAIWRQKLDWITRNGGLALVNVHPDYMAFEKCAGRMEFPSCIYRDFLAHVLSEYSEDAWFALPREVARYTRSVVCQHRAVGRVAFGNEGGR